MQSEYWRARKHEVATWVEYGNDVEGSGFSRAGPQCRDPLARTAWNLQVSLSAFWPQSMVGARSLNPLVPTGLNIPLAPYTPEPYI